MATTKKPEVKETAAKATEAAKKTVVKAAEVEKPTEKKAAPKAAEAEKPVEKKEAPKAAEAEKKPAAKKAAAKTTAKKTTAKTTTAKKTTGKKSAGGRPAARKVQVNVQFYGKDVNMKDLEKQIVDNYAKVTGAKKSSVKEIEIYVKPEENKAYYVIGGETYSIDI